MTTVTTGPFIVPSVMLNGQPIDNLVINLKNETDSEKTIRVIVHRCPEAFFPASSTETEIVNQEITLGSNRCTIFLVDAGLPNTFNQFDTLKVTITGEVKSVNDDDEEGIEAWIVTGFNGGPFEPTNFFRHKDLYEVEEDDDDD